MKKLIGAFVFLALVGASVWAYLTYGVVKVEPTIMEATISRGDITETVQATGTLEALRLVQVGSQVSGIVSEMLADYNQVVKEGQIIAKIDPSLLQVQVDIQEANIAKQETDIASQKVQLDDAVHQRDRTKDLYAAKLTTQQSLEAAELNVKTRQASIDSANKSLFQQQKSLEQAKLNVEYCTIRSPIDGVVVQRQADKGQTVQASMTSPQFFQLATDLTTLRLTGGVDESDIGKIRPGQKVTFEVQAYKKTFSGVVDRVRLNAQNQNNVVTYQVVANVANPNLELRPSMTATLKIIIETAPNVVKIPNNALRFKPTKDMYEALGATPPTPGQRPGQPGGPNGGPNVNAQPGQGQQMARNGGQGDGQDGQAPAAAATAPAAPGRAGQDKGQQAAGQTAQAQGQAGQGQGRGQGRTRTAGGGFGSQGTNANLTPEQIAQFQQQFGGRGGSGRGGGSGTGGGRNGGRGGGRQQPAANEVVGPTQSLIDRAAAEGHDKIDDMFAALERPTSFGSVWTWDPSTKSLKAINVRTGITDGQFTELVSGDLQPNVTKVLTGIIVPVVIKPGANPLMGNQPGRGGMNPGGMTPGNQGGGAGGRGAGGGGGGRGGN